MIIVGAVLVMVHNASAFLALVTAVFGRIRRLTPVLRMSMAYPLAARFRTGTTLAMFTLVVFTLVTGTASNGSFVHAIGVEDFGGGFQVRAGTTGAAPIDDMAAALRRTPGVDARDFTAVGSQSVLAVEAKQAGAGRPFETYLARGLDAPFLEHTTFGLGDIANGYASPEEVWKAVRTQRTSRSSTARSCRGGTTGTSACFRTSSSPASTSRKASTRFRWRSSTSRPAAGRR
jgi:putative ABC transport system permease protein